jgi:AcrR family transcriptional regulator
MKRNDTVERILRSARKIFSEHPYHTASIRMIGNDAGLNYPLIAYYFSTKAALFLPHLQQLIRGGDQNANDEH